MAATATIFKFIISSVVEDARKEASAKEVSYANTSAEDYEAMRTLMMMITTPIKGNHPSRIGGNNTETHEGQSFLPICKGLMFISKHMAARANFSV